jgi:hypothetical protein
MTSTSKERDGAAAKGSLELEIEHSGTSKGGSTRRLAAVMV